MNSNSIQYHEDAVVKNLTDSLYELMSSEYIKDVWPEDQFTKKPPTIVFI